MVLLATYSVVAGPFVSIAKSSRSAWVCESSCTVRFDLYRLAFVWLLSV